MKHYRIVKDILLSFLTPQDQTLERIGPDQATLEADEHTIWAITPDGKRHESITTANAIGYFLKDGSIEELPPQ